MKPADRTRIRQAIAQAEEGTSGRIAVRILNHRTLDALQAAHNEFHHLGLHRHTTANAALILVAPNARRFAVIGDRALHGRVGERFWDELATEMRGYMAYGQFSDGIVHAIDRLGEAFHAHFAQGANA